MKRKTKVLLAALSAMLIMVLSVTIISFSLAGNNDGSDTISGAGDLADASASGTLSNIDYVIKATNSVDPEEQIYHVVEIGPGTAGYSLENFINSGAFAEYVLDGHKSTYLDMNTVKENISYTYYQANTVTKDNTTALADISNADLIYVSNTGLAFSAANDIPEDLYDILHTYAVGNYKPLIIDSPTTPGKVPNPDGDEEILLGNLVADYFESIGKFYYTFGWGYKDGSQWSTDYFLSGAIGTDSVYLGINGSKRSNKWSDVVFGDGETEKMSDILVISNSGDSNSINFTGTMNSRLLEGATIPSLMPRIPENGEEVATNTDATPSDATPSDAPEIPPYLKYADGTEFEGTENIFDIEGTPLYEKGYNVKYNVPKYAKLTQISIQELENATDFSFDDYDMIIFENDLMGNLPISSKLNDKIVAAVYAGNHIIYDTKLSNGSQDDDDDDSDDIEHNDTNYHELFYMVATEKEVARYQNVMVTNQGTFYVIANSNSVATCDSIANLINNSSFRGIGGPGSSSNMYTVLEIQPCYPVDTDLVAENKANGLNPYYNRPADVLTGKAKEELEEGTEYYAWELTKAKIADVTDLDVSQIALVQMSSEEFAASKTEVLGNYDLVYIGGNSSALKEATGYSGIVGAFGGSGYNTNTLGGLFNYNLDALTYYPIYSMYSHNGDMVRMSFINAINSTGVPGKQVYGTVEIDGKAVDSFAVLNGNDISARNLEYLKEYVDAGMPVVFSSAITASYDIIASAVANSENPYLQNSIDPDCNMSKFLKYCYDLKSIDGTTKSEDYENNILWNFDQTAVVETDNDGGRLSSTVARVMVFADTKSDSEGNEVSVVGRSALKQLCEEACPRPKLAITKSPKIYNRFDTSTRLDTGKFEFEYDVSGSTNYEASLYIDDDGNSQFTRTGTDSEKFATSKTNKLTCNLASSFYGPVYWMLEIKDRETGATVSTTGLSYVKNPDEGKQKVEVLQILPGEKPADLAYGTGESAQGYNSLYFCPICQQTYQNLTYNPMSNAGTILSSSMYYAGNYGDNRLKEVQVQVEDAEAKNILYSYIAPDGKYYYPYTKGTYSMNNMKRELNIGLHEHEFGIVQYDSNKVLLDEGGNKIPDYELDADGNKIQETVIETDENGNIVYEQAVDENGQPMYEQAVDENGNLLYEQKKKDNGWELEYEKVYLFNEDGSPMMDWFWTQENGYAYQQKYELVPVYDLTKPVYDMDKPIYTDQPHYVTRDKAKTDANGNVVYQMGADDWSTNLADQISDLYDVDIDILYRGEYEQWSQDIADMYVNYTITPEEQAEVNKGDKANPKVVALVNAKKSDLSSYATSEDGSETEEELAARKKDAVMSAYSSLALEAWSDYENQRDKVTKVKEDELRAVIKEIISNVDTVEAGNYILSDDPGAWSGKIAGGNLNAQQLKDQLQDLLDTRHYYNYYSFGSDAYYDYSRGYLTEGKMFTDYYEAYVAEKDEEILLKKKAKEYDRYANPDYWLYDCYDTVILGPAENFAGDDITNLEALAQIKAYLEKKGQLILFHETVAKTEKGAVQLTNTIRDLVGINRNHMEIDDTKTKNGVPLYVPYKLTSKYKGNEDKYFMTNLSYKSGDDKYASWYDDMKVPWDANTDGSGYPLSRYLGQMSYTDSLLCADTSVNPFSLPYVYAKEDYATMAKWAFDARNNSVGADKASRNNAGIITMYPFTLSDHLNITGTHPQGYAVDVENDNLTVWYSLAGGTTEYIQSSLFAATPNDGIDNYFIYSVDNVYYCGAGHTKVTGIGKDNNDERSLYINIIVNSVRNSVRQPDIDVFDFGTEENKIIKENSNVSEGGYVYEIPDDLEYPEFTFKVTLDPNASDTLKAVNMYFDLDYDSEKAASVNDPYSENDVYIGRWTVSDNDPKFPLTDKDGNIVYRLKNGLEASAYMDVAREDATLYTYTWPASSTAEERTKRDSIVRKDENGNDTTINFIPTALKLKDSYFEPYAGKYTYVVIEAIDSAGHKVYKRIKIKLKERLYNLT